MIMNPQIPPYPVNSFPPAIEALIREVQAKVQAPEVMIAMATLGAISTSCHGLLDVRLPTGQIRATTVSVLSINESGERKSGVDTILSAPIVANDEAREIRYTEDCTTYRRELRVWKVVDQVIMRRFKEAVQRDEPTDQILQELADHEAKKPLKPRLRQTMRNDISARALMDVLEGDGEAISLMTDEGEAVFKGTAMSTFSLLNKTWDGARIQTMDRGGGKHIVIRHGRSGFNCMIQPLILKDYLRGNGALARASGFWARVLIAEPVSTQGYRRVIWFNENWEHLAPFHSRMKVLMEEYDRRIKDGPMRRDVVGFSPEAVQLWITITNRLEDMIQPTGFLNDIKDFASKALEITGRVAALLHYFNEDPGDISYNHLECAFAIVAWHIDEFKRLFGSYAGASQLHAEARALEYFIGTQFGANGNTAVPRNHVLRNCGSRPVSRFDEVLDYLIANGRVFVTKNGRRRFLLAGPRFGSPW